MLAVLFFFLAGLSLFLLSPVAGAENLYASVIRFHVIAASDSESDQAVKLKVRDALLTYAENTFSDFSSREQAQEVMREKIPELEAIANRTLRENGSEDTAAVTLSEEYYPTRTYDLFSLPCGKYLSLRVLIGKAEGQNFWCVLFPPLCTNSVTEPEDALCRVGMTKDNAKTVTTTSGEYKIRFRILEIWEKCKEKIAPLF